MVRGTGACVRIQVSLSLSRFSVCCLRPPHPPPSSPLYRRFFGDVAADLFLLAVPVNFVKYPGLSLLLLLLFAAARALLGFDVGSVFLSFVAVARAGCTPGGDGRCADRLLALFVAPFEGAARLVRALAGASVAAVDFALLLLFDAAVCFSYEGTGSTSSLSTSISGGMAFSASCCSLSCFCSAAICCSIDCTVAAFFVFFSSLAASLVAAAAAVGRSRARGTGAAAPQVPSPCLSRQVAAPSP